MNYLPEFYNYLQFEKRYSTHTLSSYQTDLLQFSEFVLHNYNCSDPNAIDYKVIRSWIIKLMEEANEATTINRKLSSLKTFFKFLKKQGIVLHNPLAKIIAPKTKHRLPSFVDQTQMNQIIDNVEFDNSFEGVRNRLIVILFYVTGLRLSELINLTDANTDTINLTLKVLGKRNKERIIPISSDIANEIEKYRALKIAETIKKNNLLFVKNDGEVLYPKLVYRVVNSYLLLASSTNKKSPHVLRHTFATHLLNNGADLNAIKELLGHASLAATQVYTHNSFEKINRIYKQAHPRA